MIFKKFFLAEGLCDALFETGGVLGENADRFACSRDGNLLSMGQLKDFL